MQQAHPRYGAASPGLVRVVGGRLLAWALPLVKLSTQLRPVSLGVRGLVFDPSGAVLLVKHSYVPEWHFPGGGVEPGETAPQALARELREEAGVALIDAPRLIGLYHNPHWTCGDHVAFYEAGAWRGCERAWGVEIEQAAFFPPDALPADASPSVVQRIAERAGAPRSDVWQAAARRGRKPRGP